MENKKEYKSFFELVTKRKSFLIASLFMYSGLGLMLLGQSHYSISYLFERFGLQALGALISFISIVFVMNDLQKYKKERNFQDVDLKGEAQNFPFTELIAEIQELKNNQKNDIDYEKIEALLNQKSAMIHADGVGSKPTFSSYFDNIRSVLENKSKNADEKASILLDKGTSYAKNGIYFFIFSIIVWQMLSLFYDFRTQYIYGIISCSVLFVFIEFLSAWFLRQYRHFVDTSTYLIKVKSIFDKYYLVYLILQEAESDKESKQQLLALLSEEIKWPDTYLFKSPDISFAKEAIETMTLLAKELKKQNS